MELLQQLKLDIIAEMKINPTLDEQKYGFLRVIDMINLKLRLLEEKSLD